MDFNLVVILRESARRVPGKPAVILGETTISYAQLDALSDRVAASLSTAGMAAGDRVGLQLPNIPQFITAYFGILKAGGVVVPMNVLLKAPEIEFQLRDSGARTLITHGGSLDEAAKAAELAGLTSLYTVTDSPGPGEPFAALLAGDPPGPQLAARSRRPGGDHLHVRDDGTPKGAVLSHFTLYMNATSPAACSSSATTTWWSWRCRCSTSSGCQAS
jgi:long-chain acyl-CoA synthetase